MRTAIWISRAAIPVLLAILTACGGAGAGGGGSDGGGSDDTTVTVTYVSGGHNSGNPPVDEQVYRPGNVVTVQENTGNLARTDFTFSGWTRGSEGAVVNVSPGETFTIGEFDETLGARWELSPDADAGAYTVGLYYYTEDATLTPTPFSVSGEYAGCVDATGTENAVYVGEMTYGSTHYLVARHPTGYYSLGLVYAWADTFEPQDVYIELDTDGVYVNFGDDPPAYTVPDGGWPSGCGGGNGIFPTTNVELDTPLSPSLNGGAVHGYQFTTGASGSYTVSVTGISSGGDLSWTVIDTALTTIYGEQDDHFDSSDEVGTVNLPASSSFFVVVEEWALPSSSTVNFDLLVSSP